jgi:hypothetical protein
MPTLSFEVEDTFTADTLMETDRLINNLYHVGDMETVTNLIIFLAECARDLDSDENSPSFPRERVRNAYTELILILKSRCLPPYRSKKDPG